MSTVPSFSQYDPRLIDWCWKFYQTIENDPLIRNYNPDESLLPIYINSGAVGSAKTLTAVHKAVKHVLHSPDARFLICRRAHSDLKETVWQDLLDHLEGDFEEEVDYIYDRSKLTIKFLGGGKIITKSWADGRIKKLGSMNLSAGLMEEGAENSSDEFRQAFSILLTRIGRVNPLNSSVKENFFIINTNPDDPDHFMFTNLIDDPSKSHYVRVFYSKTEDNPFLPRSYSRTIRETYDSKTCERLLEGKWHYISQGDTIYYSYKDQIHYKKDSDYSYKFHLPLVITFDFNISAGKPMSCAVGQAVPKGDRFHYHFSEDCIMEGTKTEDILNELLSRGIFENFREVHIYGDRNGWSGDTRGVCDYDIISRWFSRHCPHIDADVVATRSANPALKSRHNLVNGLLMNYERQSFITVYRKAEGIRKGFMQTVLQKSAQYKEKETYYQHVSTAVGYFLCQHESDNDYDGPGVTYMSR